MSKKIRELQRGEEVRLRGDSAVATVVIVKNNEVLLGLPDDHLLKVPANLCFRVERPYHHAQHT